MTAHCGGTEQAAQGAGRRSGRRCGAPSLIVEVTTKTRSLSAPDIPTLDEAGLPGFDVSAWYGLWLPKGTPKNIIARLNAAVTDALADPMMRARLADLAQETFPRDQQTPEALVALQKSEIEKWWPIIKAAGIKGE